MTLSLLATKLHRPAAALDLVPRPRLLKRLDSALRGRLALVSAPAGFGKTSLVAGWLEGGQPRSAQTTAEAQTCWLSLDEGDNAPTRFWIYFISALQTARPRLGETARTAFQAPQMPELESVLVSLINDLAGLQERLILVLDDYHVITAHEIHAALDFLIEHLPPNLLLVIITREDPPLSLSRLRARGQMVEVRAGDLRFAPSEAEAFLNELMALDLPAPDVSALAERTEGWITGLRLAALSLQDADDRHAFIDAFTASHRFLTDYLVDEVLSRQAPEVRAFLRRTSILQRFNPALCDAVLGTEDSEAGSQPTLRRLEQSNLFLVPLDNQRCWYRYHHLFAQFLRLHLLEAEPDLIPTLYRRAVNWCAENGLPREALGYALEARDFPRAAALIEALAPEVLSQEGPSAVMQWIAALPADLLVRRPLLCLHYAWALTFVGRMEEAERHLHRAEELAGSAVETEAERDLILGYVAAHRAYLLFFRGEYQQTIQDARKALALLPPDDHVIRAHTAVFLGNGLRYAGDLPGALDALTLGAEASRRAGSVYSANITFVSQAELYLELGKLHQAMQVYQQALEFARQQTGRADIPFTGFSFFAIGRIYREWNQMEPAAEYLNKGVALCREWRQADALAIGLMELSFLHQDLGQFDLARQNLEEVRQIMGGIDSTWGIAMLDAFVARLELRRGDVLAAVRWAESSGISVQDELVFERGVEYQSFIETLLAQDRPAEALTMLDKLHAGYQSAGREGRALTARIWQARALADLGRRAQALAALQEALAFAEPENFIRTFLEPGPPIAALLRQLPPSAYRDRLLAAFGEPSPATPPTATPQPETAARPATATHPPSAEDALPEPLNDRERAILRLMSAGRSNREIGDELYLSENTIRWYASQIFMKMDVKGRGAAVAKARELGLL